MKTQKLLSLTLAILTLALCLVPICASAEDTITQEEAVKLVDDLLQFHLLIWDGVPMPEEKGGILCERTRADGTKYTMEYRPLKKEFSTLEKMTEYAEKFFTKELAPKTTLPTCHPDIYRIHDGKIYGLFGAVGQGMFDRKGNPIKVEKNTLTFDIIPFDDYDISSTFGPVKAQQNYTVTLEVVKTEDGWRIAGGTAVDLMFGYNYDHTIDEVPDTGEHDIIVFAILGAVSLAAVTVLAKKRRV